MHHRTEGGAAASLAFVQDFEKTCDRLLAFPESGSRVMDIEVRRLRRFPVGRFTIFYWPRAYGIQISRVLHQRRDHRLEYKKRRRSA